MLGTKRKNAETKIETLTTENCFKISKLSFNYINILPNDICVVIMCFLGYDNLTDLQSFALTCKRTLELFNTCEFLWKSIWTIKFANDINYYNAQQPAQSTQYPCKFQFPHEELLHFSVETALKSWSAIKTYRIFICEALKPIPVLVVKADSVYAEHSTMECDSRENQNRKYATPYGYFAKFNKRGQLIDFLLIELYTSAGQFYDFRHIDCSSEQDKSFWKNVSKEGKSLKEMLRLLSENDFVHIAKYVPTFDSKYDERSGILSSNLVNQNLFPRNIKPPMCLRFCLFFATPDSTYDQIYGDIDSKTIISLSDSETSDEEEDDAEIND